MQTSEREKSDRVIEIQRCLADEIGSQENMRESCRQVEQAKKEEKIKNHDVNGIQNIEILSRDTSASQLYFLKKNEGHVRNFGEKKN